jgi:predicted nucleotidyltransferase
MINNIFNDDFIDYIKLLNKHEVEYMLVGGMAVNFYGYRRSTGDMDLFVNPTEENHTKLRRVHAEFGMHMGEMEILSSFLDTSTFDVYTFGVAPVQIDIMTKCKGIDFNEAYKSVVTINMDAGFEIKLIHYEQLIAAKQASGRTRDKADIEQLELVKKKKGK